MTKIKVQGILYDEKSSYLKGPALAPPLIRKAFHSDSTNYFSEHGTDVKLGDLIEDKGDFSIADYFDIEKTTLNHLPGNNRLLTLGGDHSITYPIVKAIHQFYGKIQILHIDAHSDLYDQFAGDPYSHACPFARIMEEGYADRLVQVGIRTLNQHQKEQAKKFNVEIIDLVHFDLTKPITFHHPIYISLDMDAFDPAFAPGVSHQEPGGLTSREVIKLIHKIDVPIMGADIVEYNPNRDVQNITAALAAKMMKEILGKMIANPT